MSNPWVISFVTGVAWALVAYAVEHRRGFRAAIKTSLVLLVGAALVCRAALAILPYEEGPADCARHPSIYGC